MKGSTRMFVGWTAFEPFKTWYWPNYSLSKLRYRVKTPTAFVKTPTAFDKTATAFIKTPTAFTILSLLFSNKKPQEVFLPADTNNIPLVPGFCKSIGKFNEISSFILSRQWLAIKYALDYLCGHLTKVVL